MSRLAWLRRTEPETFERIGAALLPHDWLTYRLAGRSVIPGPAGRVAHRGVVALG